MGRVSSLGTTKPKIANPPKRGCFGGVKFAICCCFDRSISPKRQNSTSEVQPTQACVEQPAPSDCSVPCDVSVAARSLQYEYLLAAATFILLLATLATLLSRCWSAGLLLFFLVLSWMFQYIVVPKSRKTCGISKWESFGKS